MDDSNINWVLALASLLAGIGIGALGYHLLNASAGNLQKLRQRIAERDRELSALKNGLADHVRETAALVDNLRRDSEALAKRLNRDAENLSLQQPKRDLAVAEADAASNDLSVPRDYADGTRGTLSEDYGLKPGDEPQPPRY